MMQRYKRNPLNHANNKKIQKTILPQEKMASPTVAFLSVMLSGSGGGWTRTTERIPGQIYSLLQLPLCDSPMKSKNLCSFFDAAKVHLFSLSSQKTEFFFALLHLQN